MDISLALHHHANSHIQIQAIESTGQHAQDYRTLLDGAITKARRVCYQMNRHHFDSVEAMLKQIERMLMVVRGR